VDELLGATVVSAAGDTLGRITAVEANPASDLLVLDTGVLVPTRFVVGGIVDATVTVELPEGLV
jgi:ribosomal 30S subunit maturation factor RimM